MKKHTRFAVCVSCMALAGMLTVPALAHGHHGSPAYASYPRCQVEDCQRTYRHSHDGVTYCGHTRDDGHSQHVACAVDGCARLGEHTDRDGGRHHGRHC